MNNRPPIIVLINGSLRQGSSTHVVVKYIQSTLPVSCTPVFYEGLGTLPHFNDTPEPPQVVKEFRKLIKDADGVIICTPEYAFGVPGSLKNALDWTVSTAEFVNKPVALITAATLGNNAHASLLLTLGAITAKVEPGCSLLIPYIRAKMNTNNELTDAETCNAIKSLTITFMNVVTNSILEANQSDSDDLI